MPLPFFLIPWGIAAMMTAIAGAATYAAATDETAPETATERTKGRLIWAVALVLTVVIAVWLWRRK